MAVNGERPLSAAELVAAVPGLTDPEEAMRLLGVCAAGVRGTPAVCVVTHGVRA